jgi:integrase
MPEFRKTKTPGVYIKHSMACPAEARETSRCRCEPSYRARRRNPLTKKPEWSPTYKTRAEALTWLGVGQKGGAAVKARAEEGIRFEDLARRWWEGVETGAVAKRRGRRGSAYSETTLRDYRRSLEHVLLPEFGSQIAVELDEIELQRWVDRLHRGGLTRSRINTHVVVVSNIFAWGSRSTRRLVPRNPTRDLELPRSEEKPRDRVAPAEEAAQLLAALAPEHRVPYALAFYAGLRRGEIERLTWADVDLDGYRLHVRKSKSDAGTNRRPPIEEPLRPILRETFLRQGRPSQDRKVSPVSLMSGKHAKQAARAWADAGLHAITLHECRHTYASFLMAAGYTLKEHMEFMGHADLQMTQRYVKLLPQPDETNPADRLNDYLRRAAAR